MKKILYLLSILSVISFQASAYVPPIINASIVDSKGEFQAAFTYGSVGAEQYFAYGATEDLYLYISSSFTVDTIYTYSKKRSHYFFEGGFGYSSTAGYWVFSMGGAYGYGQFYNEYRNVIESSSTRTMNSINLAANHHKISIQSDIGLKKPFVELVFSNRFSVGYFSSTDPEYKISNSTISFFEPGVTLKAGPGKVKFMSQFRLGLPLNRTNTDMSYSAISIGLILHLGQEEYKVEATE